MPYLAIRDYGLIGDRNSAALVGQNGSIDWCCFPRFDSPSVFAAVLDEAKGGRFQIAPTTPFRSTQAYLPRTNILTTTFTSAGGSAVLTDFMPCGGSEAAESCYHELHRRLRCEAGTMPFRLLFQPRFDYARAPTTVRATPYGAVAAGGGANLTLSFPLPLQVQGDSAEATFPLRAGEEAWFVLKYAEGEPRPVAAYRGPEKLAETRAFWEGLALTCPVGGRWQDQVLRSFLTLHLLIYEPTGAIVAAPTTSLPEELGGERNWDYRYCWFRDAAFTVDIFYRLGHTHEAQTFMQWLIKSCVACGDRTQPVYGIDFGSVLKEEILDHLEGYKGSRPVRIGNGAARQLQTDIFGEVLLAMASYHRQTGTFAEEWWDLVESFAEVICQNWQRPDRGIWEVRGEQRHFVYSKLMGWVGLDRGIYLAEALAKSAPLERWRAVRAQIRQEILDRGWNPQRAAFVQHYETTALDASNLLMPLVGFLPATDPRIQSTLQRTMQELMVNGLVYRYRPEETYDGLRGKEGTFTLCTLWLVGALLLSGRLAEAQALFQGVLRYANPLGLFSEMIDPYTGEALGNFPQAFTHIALIHTARNLDRALGGGATTMALGEVPTH